MLCLEQMTYGNSTVYKMKYTEDGITIRKYFQDVDVEIDETQLKSVSDGLKIEIK